MNDERRDPRLPAATDLSDLAAHIRAGGLAIIPTDTVYGIGTLAADANAVARVLAAKGRGRQMPPPVLVASPDDLTSLVADIPDTARALMDAYWPGALTLILTADPALGWDLGETGGTIAVRMPDHPVTLDLLRLTGPMAVTSANHTGQPPATDAASGYAAFPGRVRAVGERSTGVDAAEHECRLQADILLLDGGPTPGPVPSTIVSLAGAHAVAPVVIRDGVLSRADLAHVLDPYLSDSYLSSVEGVQRESSDQHRSRHGQPSSCEGGSA